MIKDAFHFFMSKDLIKLLYILRPDLWDNYKMKEAEVTNIETTTTRITGRITKLNSEDGQGWGFINSPSKKFTRIYFHWSALEPSVNFLELKIGDMLEFECMKYIDKITGDDKGFRAFKIKVLS